MGFALECAAFQNGGEIPKRFTCSGADVSPALRWSDVPEGTQALALIADDPDAPDGTWTHWLIWDIPPATTDLPEGSPRKTALDSGAHQGVNDFNRIGYGGPCPPAGKPHRYFFRLYALDSKLEVRGGAGRSELERALKLHIIAETDCMGTFKR
jgi:hypothetical protein